jgi:hypothetical protein
VDDLMRAVTVAIPTEISALSNAGGADVAMPTVAPSLAH